MEKILRYKGVIEGFYGPMWRHEERLHLIRHMREWNMNIYIYSPRNDPYHRFCWNLPYPAQEMKNFTELAKECKRNGIEFSYAVSPGSSFNPDDPQCRKALIRKLKPFIELGCKFFPVFYDDITVSFGFDTAEGEKQAERQAKTMNNIVNDMVKLSPNARFLFCPTQYMTAEKSRYLCRLHAILDRRVETVVTGVDPDTDGVCPRTFSDAGAKRYFENFGRRPFFWDNFNVRDNALNILHWSPYSGRGANLDKLCTGIVLNPQNHYILNIPIFGCMGDYLKNPRKYNPQKSMKKHLEKFMGQQAAPLGMILSKWFTSEWFAGKGSGFLLSENNLPPIKEKLKSHANARYALLKEIRKRMVSLCNFDVHFENTPMPTQVAASLIVYAHLLSEYAKAMVEFCDTVLRKEKNCKEAGRRLLERVDRPETECFRLPFSLIAYARECAKIAD